MAMRIGRVVEVRMERTLRVAVTRMSLNRNVMKFMRKTKMCQVKDNGKGCCVGDLVVIQPQPHSKGVNFRVSEIVSRREASTVDKMENQMVLIRALRSGTKTLCLDNADLESLPVILSRFACLISLSAKCNRIRQLPSDLSHLDSLTTLNLGGNHLTLVPSCLSKLTRLKSLHLFNNKISEVDEDVFGSLSQLQLLNLNDNMLQAVHRSIGGLQGLRVLSLARNRLQLVPHELGQILSLCELHLENNRLKQIPDEIGNLKCLRKFYVQKNQLVHVPLSLAGCHQLQVLDISANKIELLPADLQRLQLQEFHCERNPFLPAVPVPADQLAEVLPLQELSGRWIMKAVLVDSQLSALLEAVTEVGNLLSSCGVCAVCGGPYINCWLDCVEFIHCRKMFPLQRTCSELLPVSATICCYDCFNTSEHQYFGIAATVARSPCQ